MIEVLDVYKTSRTGATSVVVGAGGGGGGGCGSVVEGVVVVVFVVKEEKGGVWRRVVIESCVVEYELAILVGRCGDWDTESHTRSGG